MIHGRAPDSLTCPPSVSDGICSTCLSPKHLLTGLWTRSGDPLSKRSEGLHTLLLRTHDSW